MKDYKQLHKELNELRIDILNYINNDETTQDLMEHFFKVKKQNPETYELLVLIYNELQLTHKTNKKYLQSILNKSYSINLLTYNNLKMNTSTNKTLYQKILINMTYLNIKKTLFITFLIIGFIFTLYEIDKNFYEDFTNNFIKIIDKLKEIK